MGEKPHPLQKPQRVGHPAEGSRVPSLAEEWSQIYPLGALLLVLVGVAIGGGLVSFLGLGDVGIDSGGGRMHLAKLLWGR